MKKSKTRKVASAVLACAAVLSLGIASGCGGCKGNKHNWDWDYDADGHWQYCTDDGCEEKTEKVSHVDETGDEKCDVCGATVHTHSYTEWVKTDATQHWKICEADGAIDESSRENHDFTNGDCKCGRANPNGGGEEEYTETATIHFHKPADFGDKVYAHAYFHDSESDSDKNLTGAWKSYEVTATDADGWYTIEVKHPDNLFDDGSFNLMIIPEDGENISVTITAAETWVNTNGNLFATKAEAVADEAVEKVEYAIYYYAPDWAEDEAVYVYTYGGPVVGEYNTVMPADGEDGWYKITFKTTLELTTFHIMFHTQDDETVKRDLVVTATETLLEGKAFYLIDNGDGVYATKAEAEEAYANQPEEPEYTETATIHFHKPEDFGDKVYAHAYFHDSESDTDKNLTGAWKSYEVTATDADGWYTIEVKHPDNLFDDGSFNLMIIPETGDSISVTITASEMWVNANGNLFATKAEAEADEEAEATEYAIYYYAPDWTTGETVYVYTYGGPVVGEYNTVMPADGTDGWYKITFETTLELTTFHVMFHTLDDVSVKRDLAVTATEALLEGKAFYLIDNDTEVYANKADAVAAYEENAQPVDPSTQNEYTVYMYAPDAESVTVSVWGNMAGAFTDGTTLSGVADHDGWFSFTFSTVKEITGGLNLNFYIDEETTAVGKYTNVAENIYFISIGGDNGYTSFDAAEAGYEEINNAQQEEKVTVTIHVHKVETWADLYGHGYCTLGDLTGAFGSTKGVADTNNDGWYTFGVEVAESVVSADGAGFTLMLFDKTAEAGRNVLTVDGVKSECWIAYDGQSFASKALAEEHETTTPVTPGPAQTQTVTIYYHGTGEISVHAYYYTDATNTVNITEWNTKPSMTADAENVGWLKVNLEIPENIFDDYTKFTAMIVGASGGDKYVDISVAETWISAKGTAFATKVEAESDDHVHDYGNSYVYVKNDVADLTYHWQVCADCGEESAKELHDYEAGSNVCTKCGYEKPVASHTHIWSENYDTSVAGYHTQTCTVADCTETNPQPHEFENLSHICTVCEHNEDEGKVRIYVKVDKSVITTGDYYIYAWGATGGDSVLGGWPGTKLDADEGNGWYSVAVTASQSDINGGHVIINNNDALQYDACIISGLSADVTEFFIDGTNGSATNPYDAIEITIRVKVDTDTVGDTPYIYIYEGASPALLGGWPGATLTAESDGWYSVKANVSKKQTGTYSIIINNNSGSQYDLGTITANNGVWTFTSHTDLNDDTLLEVVKTDA